MAATQSIIRVVEVWVPGNDRSTLEFSAGLYGSAKRFGALSRQMCFGYGEGLPGEAWQRGRPLVLKQFAGANFRRTQAAAAEGLTCGIALPIFAGDYLTAVLGDLLRRRSGARRGHRAVGQRPGADARPHAGGHERSLSFRRFATQGVVCAQLP